MADIQKALQVARLMDDYYLDLWGQLERLDIVGDHSEYLDRLGVAGWVPRVLSKQGYELTQRVETLVRERTGKFASSGLALEEFVGLSSEVEAAYKAQLLELVTIVERTNPGGQANKTELRQSIRSCDFLEKDFHAGIARTTDLVSFITAEFAFFRDLAGSSLGHRLPAGLPADERERHALHRELIDPLAFIKALPNGPTREQWSAIDASNLSAIAKSGSFDSRASLYAAVRKQAPWLSEIHRGCFVALVWRPMAIQFAMMSHHHDHKNRQSKRNRKMVGASGVPEASSSGCFPAGAQVLTSAGYRAIVEIEPGDLVVSYRSDGMATLRPVTRKLAHEKCVVQRVLLEDGVPLRVTENHSVLTSRGWLQVKALQAGDQLVRQQGTSFVLEVLTERIPEPVYNLYTAGEHTFVVDGVVVHNFTFARGLRTHLHKFFLEPLCRSTRWATAALQS